MMATYIIGDVQGCYRELQKLLEYVHYDPSKDRLGFVGDLVNRGPDSLSTLRFIKSLPNPLITLGNHDLYLLAIGYGVVDYRGHHTLQEVLNAPDKMELLDWLRQQPLVMSVPHFNSIIVHAGVPPQWNLAELIHYGELVAQHLQGPDFKNFLRDLELHREDTVEWKNNLADPEKLRYIVNALTRMRFCTKEGVLDLTNKTAKTVHPELFQPWYQWYRLPQKVLFGHWAALEGTTTHAQCVALDTGCVWGKELTAYRLEDQALFSSI
ncbi:MAG: symmetrical bis(5'-nucleosyl)-tetraphosphatase [Proteobacteria bacterium]|nr:symmetrical bis(5'-nucleosyl)-tetraphosphatase [Pseudomonadota bacterium]